MTPKMAQALDPVFLHVIDLLERIDRGEQISASSEQGVLFDLVAAAGRIAKSPPDPWDSQSWEVANYGLIAWIDEMFVDLSSGTLHEWWKNHVLERQLFGSRECREQFYLTCKDKLMRKLRTTSSDDSVEVYYICGLLGFRGLYRDPQTAPRFTSRHRLPESREEWADTLWSRVSYAQAKAQSAQADLLQQDEPDREISTARPRLPLSQTFWIWLFVIVVAGLNVVCLYHL